MTDVPRHVQLSMDFLALEKLQIVFQHVAMVSELMTKSAMTIIQILMTDVQALVSSNYMEIAI